MKRSFERFLKNRSGAFAMQFALMIVPLMACTGLAIDGGRAFLARFELGSALDAAALAVGSTSTTDETALNAVARKFVDTNFHQAAPGAVALTLTPGTDVVTLRGTVRIDTFFMPIMGVDHVNVSAESEVRRGGSNIEVALVLDTTGSMAGQRMTDLKSAAKDLIDIVVSDTQSPWYSKLSLISYGDNVYTGDYSAAVRGAATPGSAITAAAWKVGASKTITLADWKNGASKTINGAAWKYGSSKTPSAISKSSNQVTITSNSHGFANGDFVRITGVGGMTQLNNNVYLVSNVATNTFKLKDASTSTYINSSGYGTFTSGGTLQRCYDANCDVRITTSGSHGFSTGDLVHISGISGFTYANNSGSDTWTITNSTSTAFFLDGSNGFTSQTYSSGGTAQRCYDATCEVRVSATSHGFSNGDHVYISGVSGFTYANSSAGTSWTVSNTATNTFFLSGSTGMSSPTYSSGGTASKCVTAACEVQVTSASHGLANNDRVYITGVGGMTQINTSGTNSWVVGSPTSNTFILNGTTGPTYGAYSSGGTAWCLQEGCEYYRFTNASSGTVIRQISDCVSERTGAHAYDDEAPTTALVGLVYAGSGYSGCRTTGALVPLTADKSSLKSEVEGLDTNDSTAGQIGLAWGWYMISPNWGYLWPDDTNRPHVYHEEHLAKVLVLMTDGDFNTAYCHSIVAKNYAVDGNASRINCNATNGDPFTQAATLCTNIKDAGITIYTVGFGGDLSNGGGDFLKACATDDSHAYLAVTGDDLKAAFKSIAKSISLLRLSR